MQHTTCPMALIVPKYKVWGGTGDVDIRGHYFVLE